LLSSFDRFSSDGDDVLSVCSVRLAHGAMKKPRKVHPLSVLVFLFAMGLTAFCLSGCKTAGGDDDEGGSDLPWNTPQSWEGAPSIPGMSGMGR
jgi:hypothetical protein